MDLNHKQEELINELFLKIKEKYPEIEFLGIQPSPGDRDLLWIKVLAPINEDRRIELRHYASELETDILLDYGYSMAIMPQSLELTHS